MSVALARHDELVRSAVEARGGRVFKTIGDAFCAAFPTVAGAVSAALDSQLALHVEPWPNSAPIKVRMAVHTGAAEFRDDDYFGTPLNLVSRLLSAAHGGQVLLSSAAAQLGRDDMPSDSALRDLGEQRLKGFVRTENVYQLLHPRLPKDFPPLRAQKGSGKGTNLPKPITSFIGREKELDEVRGLLARTRLLTLTGAAGCGKTRLALEAALEVDRSSGGGTGGERCWLVDLAPLSNPSLVPHAVAGVLSVREEPDRQLIESIADNLESKRLILLLDNCEHVLDACASLCDTLLRRCPGIRVLATSREALGIDGELTYRVPSLSSPGPRTKATLESLLQYESVRLLLDRAKLHRPNFAPTDEDAAALASICSRLDGIPLAIELAAARLRTLSLSEINERLDQRFRLLTGGPRTALPRQQTLRSLIDWSYDLLDEDERAMMRRLAVFVGGCTLSAAEFVFADDAQEGADVLDLISRLVDKSLVQVDDSHMTTRYRMLETVRQYAREKLLESGEGEHLRNRHAKWFCLESQSIRRRHHEARWNSEVRREFAEMDNLRSALDWAICCPEEGADALWLAIGLCTVCLSSDRLMEGRERAAEVLAAVDAERHEPLVGKLLTVASMLAWMCGDFNQCREMSDRAAEILERHEDDCELVYLYGVMTMVRRAQNDRSGMESVALKRIAAAERTAHPVMLAEALRGKGIWLDFVGRHNEAHTALMESLAYSRKSGYELGEAQVWNCLGEIAREMGDYEEAARYYEKGLAIFEHSDVSWAIQMVELNLAYCCLELGWLERAATLLFQGIQRNLEFVNRAGLQLGLAGVASLLARRGEHANAARLFGASMEVEKAMGGGPVGADRRDYDRIRDFIRSTSGDRFESLLSEGRALGQDAACRLAISELRKAVVSVQHDA